MDNVNEESRDGLKPVVKQLVTLSLCAFNSGEVWYLLLYFGQVYHCCTVFMAPGTGDWTKIAIVNFLQRKYFTSCETVRETRILLFA